MFTNTLEQAETGEVKVLDGLFRERMNINRNYLLELDSTSLLQNFYLEAGIIIPGIQVLENPQDAKLHWGWEAPTCQLRGHFLGHWLSAAALLCGSENDAEMKVKLDKIISELARCQQLNGGEWIGSIPEKYFQKLARAEYIWSPQYTMHKTLMGLLHAYIYAGNEQAVQVCDKLSDWYIRWTDEMLKTAPNAIYSGEAGGMLEIWAWLYQVTGKAKYLTLADRYSGDGLLQGLADGNDTLTGNHANASIPLAHGAAKMYEVTGDEKWRNIVERFWKCAVTDRGSYATSGMNSGEFWVAPHRQGEYLSCTNQEFCTVYNMVRLADYLYRWTGDTQYSDYTERCLYNGFLAQQNKFTGMPTYFLPLESGVRKKWGSKTHDFWCCYGTMVQAQTLYPQLIYFTDKTANRVAVSQYIPSEYTADGISIKQSMAMRYYSNQSFFDDSVDNLMTRWAFDFNVSSKSAATVSLRVPCWEKTQPQILLNGKKCGGAVYENGYVSVTRVWDNDVLSVLFHSGITMERLDDMPELAAAVEGPIVLAALTDKDAGLIGDFAHPETFLSSVTEHTYEDFPWRQSCYRTRRQPVNFSLKPLYDITDETYTVYLSEK